MQNAIASQPTTQLANHLEPAVTPQPMKMDDLPEILTADIIAQYLQVGYGKALHLIKHGGIPHLRLGNVYRVPKRQFEEWLLGGGSSDQKQ